MINSQMILQRSEKQTGSSACHLGLSSPHPSHPYSPSDYFVVHFEEVPEAVGRGVLRVNVPRFPPRDWLVLVDVPVRPEPPQPSSTEPGSPRLRSVRDLDRRRLGVVSAPIRVGYQVGVVGGSDRVVQHLAGVEKVERDACARMVKSVAKKAPPRSLTSMNPFLLTGSTIVWYIAIYRARLRCLAGSPEDGEEGLALRPLSINRGTDLRTHQRHG
jgi:hypothetical protein